MTPRLGVKSELQPQQHEIQATSVTYTMAHGNNRSLTHWARPGIKPASSWILVWFIFTAPQWELPVLYFCLVQSSLQLCGWVRVCVHDSLPDILTNDILLAKVGWSLLLPLVCKTPNNTSISVFLASKHFHLMRNIPQATIFHMAPSFLSTSYPTLFLSGWFFNQNSGFLE